MLEASEILFMGLGKSAVLWYRCALPSVHIGADWVGVRGEPPGVQVLTGIVRGDTTLPHYDDYKVVVIQQPHGRAWLTQINALKARGIKVLYEVDDYLHGVAKQPGHDFARFYTKELLKGYELCMRACDGIICSTEYIARRYARFNRNLYVCRNGLDVARYQLTRPERPFAVPSGVVELPLFGGANRDDEGRFQEADQRVGSTFVSAGDVERARPYQWLVHPSGYAYAVCGDERENVYLHRLVTGCPDGLSVDHLNQDKLDNRRENLEAITENENKRRRMFREGSPTRGTCFNGKTRKWTAYVDTPAGRQWLGHAHPTQEAAGRAVGEYRAEHQPIQKDGPSKIERMVMIGWAGATGHMGSILPWINAAIPVMGEHPDTGFVVIGQPSLADPLNQILGPGRAIGIPFAPIECYPAAMCMFDIALAPAGSTSWYKGKSDLRWLEAAALGVPIIADPYVYPEIEHGVTGFHAETQQEMSEALDTLVRDVDLRERVGQAAREYVFANRTSDIAAAQWFEVCSAVVGGYESVSQLRRA